MAAVSTIAMTDNEFTALRKLIYDRAGIWFADQKRYLLESRLGSRLTELEIDNYDQYYKLLTTGPFRDDEFQSLCDRVTINETSFFRNEAQLKVFEDIVLPEMIHARSANKTLRIWSAACSTGEEPYTLAMILHRSLGIRLMDWRIEILGTDLSMRALETAQAGRFTSYSVRSMPPLMVDRHFKKEGMGYILDPTIQQMVRFERFNLRDHAAAGRFGKWDIIFCRNVMIYFDDDMRAGCLNMFHRNLAHDGTLFIGHSETIRDDALFESRHESEAFAYRRKG